jgi:hypothetical protein
MKMLFETEYGQTMNRLRIIEYHGLSCVANQISVP